MATAGIKIRLEEVEVQRLGVKPGDVVVVRLPDGSASYHSAAYLEGLRDRLKEILPEGVKALVLAPGVDLEVITPDGDSG